MNGLLQKRLITPYKKGILDLLPGGAGFSLRRLRGSYSGPAIRVRRSSDNAEQDIGFNGNGDLDTVALLAFVGAGSGYVVTWYDQSGNGRHFTQSTSGFQPRIVNSGVIDTKNSKPAIVFDGSDDRLAGNSASLGLMNNVPGVSVLSVTAPAAASTNATLLMISSNVASATSLLNMRYGSTNRFSSVVRRAHGDGANSATSAANNAFTSDALIVHGLTVDYTAPLVTVYKDGVSNYTGSSGITNTPPTAAFDSVAAVMGAIDSGASPFSGSVSELIFYRTALSNGDRQTVEANQKAYYGTA